MSRNRTVLAWSLAIVSAVAFATGAAVPRLAQGIAQSLVPTLAAQDPVVPPAQILAFTAAMSAAGVNWQLHLYGGVGHSFTNPAIDALGLPGFSYHAEAERRSWAALIGLLSETLAERPL